MAEQGAFIWRPRGSWTDIAETGRFGTSGASGITVQTLDDLGLASLIARPGSDALERATKRLLSLDLPRQPSAALSETHGLIWSGPNQWLLLARRQEGFSDLLGLLSADAAVIDQSNSRAALRISGERVREVLAKGSMVDLHPSVFPVGAAASTSFAHVGVQFWRTEDGPDGSVFEILVARSMAGSFWSWLVASAAEYGCRVN